MNYTTILRSSLGTFATRIGLSVAVFFGVLYLASVGPVVLGIYTLFVAVIRVLDLLTNVGIVEAAQKRISEGRDRNEFFTAALVVRLSLFVPVALVLFVFSGRVAAYIGTEIVIPFLIVGLFSSLVHRTIESGLTGEKKVARAGLLQFVAAIGRLVSWVVLVSLGYGLFGVLSGYIIGEVLAIATGLALFTLKLRRPSRERFLSLFRFAKFSWVDATTTQSWVWTDTVILGFFVAPALIGIYELSWQITGVLFLLSSAISATLLPNVSELSTRDEHEHITDLTERALVYTGILAIPGFVGGVLFAEPILAAFGEEYRAGAVVVVVLVLARVFHSYEVVFGQVLNALDRPDLRFRANAAFIAANIVLNVIAISTIGWVGAAFATTAAMVLKTALTYRYIRPILAFTVPRREILMEVCAALVMGVCLWVLVPVSTVLPIFETALFIGFGAVIYAVSVLLLVDRIRAATLRVVYELLVRTRGVNN